jgi:hypothetical protein
MDRKSKTCKRELKEASMYYLSFFKASPCQQRQQCIDLHLRLLQIYLKVCYIPLRTFMGQGLTSTRFLKSVLI